MRTIRTPLTFLVRIGAVALAMALLPLLYFALIGLAAFGVYEYITEIWPRLAEFRPIKVRFLAYAAPPLAGFLLIAFMVKSAFPRHRHREAPHRLDPARETVLFEFVRKLCDAVGSPRPSEISVDLVPNASAGPRLGFGSLLRRDLRLTLGLPLVEGLDAGELASVIAHEFGHFAQRTAMTLTYVIRSINGWFASVVYDRDDFDHQLEQAAREAGWAYGLILRLSQLFLWMSRRILWLLLHIGHGLSSFLSRQMEHDADRHAMALAGSASAANAMRDLVVLNVAHRSAMHELEQMWHEGRLAPDIPALVAAHRDVLRPALLGFVAHEIQTSQTRLFDTHPAVRERLARFERRDEPGVFRGGHPATVLFRDFRELARRVTRVHCESRLGDLSEVRWREDPLPEQLLLPPGVDPGRLGSRSDAGEDAGR